MLRWLLVVIAMIASLAASSASGSSVAAQDNTWFRSQIPEPGSIVPAGTRMIQVTLQASSNAQISLLLNTEVIPFERSGDGGEVRITSRRALAPGVYDVTVVAHDQHLGIRKASWRFRTQMTDAIPPDLSQVDARIEVVFPHDGAPVTEAKLANIGAYLFTPGTLIPVPMDFERPVRLWRAVDSGPAEPVAVGTKVSRTVGSVTFPAWEFNDVDVSAANDPRSRIFFFVSVDDTGVNGNVWVHGADPRTSFALQDVPRGVRPWPNQVNAKVEIVYPHDGAPVGQARLANIATDVYARGTDDSVDFARNPMIHLLRSTNAGVPTYAATGERVDYQQNGLTYPRWVFNDIDVSAATSGAPPNLILLRNLVDGQTTFSNVWAHGVDARTLFPIQDVPSQSAQATMP